MEEKRKTDNYQEKGISLLVLVITIVVIIIIAGAVILNLSKNNPITEAKKARFLSDIDTFRSELSMYILSKQTGEMGEYDGAKLYADSASVTENGSKNTSKTIENVITSMKNTEYIEKLEVIAGELVYVGASKEESSWCSGIIDTTNFEIDITAVPDMESISGKVTLKGALVDKTKIEWYKVYIKKATDSEYGATEQYKSTEKEKEINYNINGLQSGVEYVIKVEVKMADETDVRSKETKKIRTISDNIPPQKPSIAVPSEINQYDIEGITVTLKDNEGGSGINENECKYIVNKVSTEYGIESSIWNTASKIENIVNGSANIEYTATSDGEYYVHVLAVDNVGNKIVGKSEKIVVDTEAPNVEGIVTTLSPNSWTNENVKVTLSNIPSDAVTVEYTLPNSTIWQTYNSSVGINVSENGDGNIRVKDKLGNEAIKTYTVDKIDKDVPSSATFTPNTISNLKNVEVQISAEDATSTGTNNKSGIASIKYQWTTSNVEIGKEDSSWNIVSTVSNNGKLTLNTVTGTRYLQILVMDNAGNKKVFISGNYTLDNTAPDVSGIVSSLNPNDWTNGNVKVTLSNIPSDATTIEYTLPNSTTWQTYNSSTGITVSENGDGNIRVKDIAGNEATKTYTVDKIDKDMPASVTFTPNIASNVKSVEVQVSAEDATPTGTNNKSGVGSIKYQWTTSSVVLGKEDSSWNTASTVTNNEKLTLNAITGTRYLQLLVTDKAGNKKVFVSGSYILDNTAPDVSGIVSSLNPNDWTNGNVKVTLSNIPSDATTIEYTLPNSTTWQTYNSSTGITVSENGDGSIRVKDIAGNEAVKTYTISKIDKEAPSTVTFTPNGDNEIKGTSIKVQINAEDAKSTGTNGESGIASIKYQWDGGNDKDDSSWNTASEVSNNETIVKNGNANSFYTLYILVMDNAGNKRVFSEEYTTGKGGLLGM